MKKSLLFIACLLSLLILSACLPFIKRNDSSSPSNSSYSQSSKSSSGKEGDYEKSSSFSSSSGIEDDPYTLFNDFGQSLDALSGMDDIDKWEGFKSINLTYFEENSDRVATTKDEVRAKFGQPSSELDSGGDLWQTDKYDMLISYDNDSVTNKLILFKSSDKVESLDDISKGMSAQDVFRKLGKPRAAEVTGMFTRCVWADEDDKDYYIYFKGNKVDSTEEP